MSALRGLKSFGKYLIVAAILIGSGAFVLANYSWVFAKRVHGRILNVERVTDPNAIISARVTEAQMHTYAILIQGEDGRLYTANSENSRWEIAKKGYCVDALLYRRPFWELKVANTFYDARLDELSLCPGETAPPQGDPAPPAAKPAEGSATKVVVPPDTPVDAN